jgi:hypothetical protein
VIPVTGVSLDFSSHVTTMAELSSTQLTLSIRRKENIMWYSQEMMDALTKEKQKNKKHSK